MVPDQVISVNVPDRTKRSGAITANARFVHDLRDDDNFRDIAPAETAVITSPKKADGTHANIEVRKNGNPSASTKVIAGGQTVTISGPIWRLEIIPDATVAGTGVDDVEIVYSGRSRRGR